VRLKLVERSREDGVARLEARLDSQREPVLVRYRTRTGAVLRADGVAAGAFDREHHDVLLPPCDRPRTLTLDVELHALPTNGLPSGPGVIWWFLNRRAYQEPARALECSPQPRESSVRKDAGGERPLKLIGHSHLDVAWLWTYEETRRKAQRTFAIACDLLDRDPSFVFIQSQPQLYAFVEQDDPELFERIRGHVLAGRIDASVAALWVESDCNVPSGESLLRQMLAAKEYCEQRFGVTPSIAWLPDTFGFANTLPQLLAHAGIPYFSTTKLQWNDTTKFPYPQFVWKGPDGSAAVSALIASYDGPAFPWRIARAKERNEPIVLGYGDGGGGVTPSMLEHAPSIGRWIAPRSWFDELESKRSALPVHDDELYLEYHRGVYTTHHDVKFHNALLERALAEAEELLSWCIAVHAPAETIAALRSRLDAVWHVTLRSQFHDVLPGTSIEAVYEAVMDEYAAAEEQAASVISAAQTILPRARGPVESRLAEPQDAQGEYVFENGSLFARVRTDGTITELRAHDGPNLCTVANALALYRDRPKAWEAWNVDASYAKVMRNARPRSHSLEDGVLSIAFRLGSSDAAMRISLREAEPLLRVELDVQWQERRTLLRVENWIAVASQDVVYGSPHGSIVRTAHARTPAERAKFEVPGQRYAAVRGSDGAGAAVLALDTYGWSARALPRGGIRLGHSLLRGTTWPDPKADIGPHRLLYAFAPLRDASNARLERLWEHFAHGPRVRLFVPSEPNVVVAACKPAHDGDGVVLRVRECDGTAVDAHVRCGARMTDVQSIDGMERPLSSECAVEGEQLRFGLRPFEIRSFRVRFSHA